MCDYDSDGDLDIYHPYSRYYDGERFLRNTGEDQYEDVSDHVGMSPSTDLPWRMGRPVDDAVFFDVDRDGNLDLYAVTTSASTVLYRNSGDGTFRDATVEAGLDKRARAVHVGDLDNDGDPDLLLRRWSMPLAVCDNLADVMRSAHDPFDPLRGDVLAPGGDDQILLAVGDLQEAIFVDLADVAGVQPAIIVDRRPGRLGVLEVALHDVRADAHGKRFSYAPGVR